jgi:hypothetical protein
LKSPAKIIGSPGIMREEMAISSNRASRSSGWDSAEE